MPSPEERLRTQLEEWRRDLINLTRNNWLLDLRPGSVLELVEPGAAEAYARLGPGLKVQGALEADLWGEEGRSRPLRPGEVRIKPTAKASLASKLRNLDRNATQTFMDRGLWILYLASGLLEWKEAPREGAAPENVLSPLLLVPRPAPA